MHNETHKGIILAGGSVAVVLPMTLQGNESSLGSYPLFPVPPRAGT